MGLVLRGEHYQSVARWQVLYQRTQHMPVHTGGRVSEEALDNLLLYLFPKPKLLDSFYRLSHDYSPEWCGLEGDQGHCQQFCCVAVRKDGLCPMPAYSLGPPRGRSTFTPLGCCKGATVKHDFPSPVQGTVGATMPCPAAPRLMAVKQRSLHGKASRGTRQYLLGTVTRPVESLSMSQGLTPADRLCSVFSVVSACPLNITLLTLKRERQNSFKQSS